MTADYGKVSAVASGTEDEYKLEIIDPSMAACFQKKQPSPQIIDSKASPLILNNVEAHLGGPIFKGVTKSGLLIHL